jgi:hypothetical protein
LCNRAFVPRWRIVRPILDQRVVRALTTRATRAEIEVGHVRTPIASENVRGARESAEYHEAMRDLTSFDAPTESAAEGKVTEGKRLGHQIHASPVIERAIQLSDDPVERVVARVSEES